MRTRRPTTALIVVAAFALPASPAQAATPESGKVSKAAPVQKWSGSAQSFPLTLTNILVDGGTLCEPSTTTCDRFTLEVLDTDLLTVQAKSTAITQMSVFKPDGSEIFTLGGSANGDVAAITIKDAPPGSYKVEVYQNALTPTEYAGRASLGAALAKAGSENKPPTSPPPTQGSAPAKITISPRAASSRSLEKSRKLTLSLSSTAPVTEVRATLTKGSKKVASGFLAKLDSKGKLTMKLPKRVKEGSYRVVLTAKGQDGKPVSASSTLKVKR